MSLQTGTEIITLALLLNKITGIYGLIAVLTGYALSALQLSMYLYSVLCVAALAFLMPHIRKQTPFHNLALAWLYLLDTAINAAYTTSFAVAWYLAGFHDPEGTAGKDASPNTPGVGGGNNGTYAGGAGSPREEDLQARETAVSMVTIVALTLVRAYFAVVVAGHARAVLLRFAEGRPVQEARVGVGGAAQKGRVGNPFAEGTAEGDGWRGGLGRVMVSVGEGYWLGSREDEEWTRDVSSKFRSAARSQGGERAP